MEDSVRIFRPDRRPPGQRQIDPLAMFHAPDNHRCGNEGLRLGCWTGLNAMMDHPLWTSAIAEQCLVRHRLAVRDKYVGPRHGGLLVKAVPGAGHAAETIGRNQTDRCAYAHCDPARPAYPGRQSTPIAEFDDIKGTCMQVPIQPGDIVQRNCKRRPSASVCVRGPVLVDMPSSLRCAHQHRDILPGLLQPHRQISHIPPHAEGRAAVGEFGGDQGDAQGAGGHHMALCGFLTTLGLDPPSVFDVAGANADGRAVPRDRQAPVWPMECPHPTSVWVCCGAIGWRMGLRHEPSTTRRSREQPV